MSRSSHTDTKPHSTKSAPENLPAPTKAESARYTYAMLMSLKKIAALHNEAQLMRLIEAAAVEAWAVSKSKIA